ncbi:hypothetical protein MSIBF_A780002 [groundwater metagenome]|uniref:Transposase n=1 Tax=groundwater metagenome TaxID=717931 RepID=A0A098EEL0_9ZZZZ
METCPKCKSTDICKNGIVKQKQRYLCKKCKYCFTVEHIGKSDNYKRDALILYLEGLGFRSIGRFLKVSHVAVFNWIKKFGKQLYCATAEIALFIEWHIVCCLRTRDLLFAYITVS